MATFRGDRIPTSYATCSIGHKASHNLPAKLKAISAAGFEAIELSMPDILAYGAEIKNVKEIDPKDYNTLEEIGHEIKKLVVENHLKILMLQPFANFEGWPKGSEERRDAFERADGWMRVMKAVGTDMLQIGSSDSPGISSDLDVLAADLAELADKMKPHGFRIAYENWCWATHAPDWEDVWKIVQKADRNNIGLCLDTFQSAGGEWADPTSPNGLLQQHKTHHGQDENQQQDQSQDQDQARANLEKAWKSSLAKLTSTIPPEKIYLLQISDAYLMNPPLADQTDDSGTRPRGQWSHDYRPLPFDGGYLPINDFTAAVMNTGFRGYLSMEVFDGRGPEKYPDDMLPYARQAMSSLQRLLKEAES